MNSDQQLEIENAVKAEVKREKDAFFRVLYFIIGVASCITGTVLGIEAAKLSWKESNINVIMSSGCKKVHECMNEPVDWLPTCGKIAGEIHTCYYDRTMCYTDLNHSCSDLDKQLSVTINADSNYYIISTIVSIIIGVLAILCCFAGNIFAK